MKKAVLITILIILIVFVLIFSPAFVSAVPAVCAGVKINCKESSVDCDSYDDPAKNVIYNKQDETLQFSCNNSTSDGLCPENFFTGECAEKKCTPEDIDCLPKPPEKPPENRTIITKPEDACKTQEKIEIIGSVDVKYSADIFCEAPPCKIVWDFGDGSTKEETTNESYVSSGTHTYNETQEMGPVKISLKVIDSNKETEDFTRIYLDTNKNDKPIACIDWPKGIINIEEGQVASVTFNATSSFDDITLKEKMIYNWTITEIGMNEIVGKPSGKGLNVFDWTFGKAGKYETRLIVNDSDPVDVAEEEFTITGCILNKIFIAARGRCSGDKRFYCSPNDTLYTTMGDAVAIGVRIGGCEGRDGKAGVVNGKIDDCCPANYFCPAPGETCKFQQKSCSDAKTKTECEKDPLNKYCVWIDGMGCVDPAGLSCSDYPNEQLCSEDRLGLGQYGIGIENCGASFPIDGGTFTIINCSCKWDEWNRACNLEKLTIINPNPQNNPYYTCKINIIREACDETIGRQKIIVKTNITWTTPVGVPNPTNEQKEEAGKICTDREYSVLCGAKAAGLPFFTFFSFAMVLLFLVIYYLTKINKTRRK